MKHNLAIMFLMVMGLSGCNQTQLQTEITAGCLLASDGEMILASDLKGGAAATNTKFQNATPVVCDAAHLAAQAVPSR